MRLRNRKPSFKLGKPLAPILGQEFTILVVPQGEVVKRQLTIPQTYFAPKRIRAAAHMAVGVAGAKIGMTLDSMGNPKRVVRALRALADYIENGGNSK